MATLKQKIEAIEKEKQEKKEAKRNFITLNGIEIEIPQKPADRLIANYGLPKEKQKFRKTPKPHENAPEEEIREFLSRDLEYWKKGYWVFIYGTATYIPPKYYFILNYIEDDDGEYEYRDAQRRYMIHKEFCEKDPLSLGSNLLKGRRFGATGLELGSTLFDAITTPNAKCGLLSKSGKRDAGENFERLTRMFDRLVNYIKPQLDGKARGKSRLSFVSPTRKITVNNKENQKATGLDSEIDWAACSLNAYDGKRKYRIHVDEPGKWEEVSVKKWWEIGKRTLVKGRIVVGKAAFTTTINEQNKGGKHFKMIYLQSDYFKKDANGRTTSGLYKYFVPAYDGYDGYIDEYGNSVVDAPTKEQLAYLRKTYPGEIYQEGVGAKQYLLNERASKAGDPDGLSELTRQLPFTEEEALRSYEGICHFNASNIESQLRFLEENDLLPEAKIILVRGNFMWENGIKDTKVAWSPDPAGRWEIAWLPPDGERNRFQIISQGERVPIAYQGGVFGCDPFDHDDPIDPRASKCASHGYRLLDPTDPHNSDIFTTEYLFRQQTASLQAEDLLMMCVFYGWKIFLESNRAAVVKKHFKDRGYGAYLLSIPAGFFDATSNQKMLEGVSATKAAPGLVAAIEALVAEKCNRVFFKRTLNDWRDFTAHDTQKFDLTMSSGYTLLAAQRYDKIMSVKSKEAPIQLLRTFDNSGMSSRANR